MRKTEFFELFSRHSAKNMRENSVFSRSSRQLVLTKFAKNAEKQRFLRFLLDVIQKSDRKRCFFTSFETLCTKFAKNAKIAFSWDLCATIRKRCEKTVFFFKFFETLCIKFVIMRKNSVFWAFCTMSRERCEKSVFFHVFKHFYEDRKKMWKNSVFDLQDVPQKVWEQCFSTLIETLCSKFAKNAEKQRFLSFLRDVLQKSVRKQCFSRLSRHIVQSWWRMWKTAFFEIFARWSAKTVIGQCFFTSSETLCRKFAKNAKKQRFFFKFLRDDPQKVWKNSVFYVFRDTLYKVCQKCRKNSDFVLFARRSAEKC